MGATYTRQEASNITDGSVIQASHLNNELNQLLAAFASSTGHSHDGTSAEGGYVPLIADSDANNKILVDTSSNRFGVFVEVSSNPVEQFRFQDGAIVPVTNNDIDLGTVNPMINKSLKEKIKSEAINLKMIKEKKGGTLPV